MKTFTFTFIFYILLLLAQPCQDTFVQVSRNDESETINERQPAEDDTQPEDCSPFCICACRQVPTAYHYFTSINVEVKGSATRAPAFEYQNPYTKNFHDSIWQPPKA